MIQSDLFWEDKERNLDHFSEQIGTLPATAQVVLLPEMFATGFSMRPGLLAEGMDGPCLRWMARMAREHRKIIGGSLIIEDAGQYFNRFVWMMPDGRHHFYDKRHLFAYGGEDEAYTAGQKRCIVQANGWKVNLQVCYDLRFPVWSRQPPSGPEEDKRYDVLVYVANWPERRSAHWDALLVARAIENQCFVIGLNRVGVDGNGIGHAGGSKVIGPWGEVLHDMGGEQGLLTFTLEDGPLAAVRDRYPFAADADRFLIL